MHELTHARQWDRLGLDTFLSNYLLETLLVGYGSDNFEREANALRTDVQNAVAAAACPPSPLPPPPPPDDDGPHICRTKPYLPQRNESFDV